MQTIRESRQLKVAIGSKWIDPTLDNPYLRTLPRGTQLHVPAEPVPHLGDACVAWACGIAAVLLAMLTVAQMMGAAK